MATVSSQEAGGHEQAVPTANERFLVTVQALVRQIRDSEMNLLETNLLAGHFDSLAEPTELDRRTGARVAERRDDDRLRLAGSKWLAFEHYRENRADYQAAALLDARAGGVELDLTAWSPLGQASLIQRDVLGELVQRPTPKYV